MIRLNAVVEGQTEETFVNRILAAELAHRGVYVAVTRVTTTTMTPSTRTRRRTRTCPTYLDRSAAD